LDRSRETLQPMVYRGGVCDRGAFNLFVPVDKKSKIYVRQVAPRSPYLRFNSSDRPLAKVKPMLPSDEDSHSEQDLLQSVDRIVLVIPLKIGADGKPYLLVLFQEFALAASTESIAMAPARQSEKGKQTALEQENSRLKQELATTREYLESIIEEQESTNQALQVANEEILSSNEELQSTNEELETSQEELQATNEELHTSNEELNNRNSELKQINNDLQNLLSSINIPILMLDGELRIRRFTNLAQQICNLIPTDLGRPFSDIQPNIAIPDLAASIQTVIDTLTIVEREVQDRAGHWYSLRIRPYRTSDNRIDGVTIWLIDIDTLKQTAAIWW
jgi:two-component system, chemotaxis family, CheB/CheR fusion protein